MKRSDRLIGITSYFINHPQQFIQLTFFVEAYNASKSSISEDLDIVNEMFIKEGIGSLHRISGATGGVRYIPHFDKGRSAAFINRLCDMLEDPGRILPGGYLYMSDLLGDPLIVKQIGQVFVSAFSGKQIDAVVTVETKGIPLAYAVASLLNVPVVVIRRNMRVTEGSSISINYVSGRSGRIQTMILPKRLLKEGMKVCIIDDFMKAGGTVAGMISLLTEFKATVVGIGVFAKTNDEQHEQLTAQPISLVKVAHIDTKQNQIKVQQGDYFCS
jgi:purine operon repressor